MPDPAPVSPKQPPQAAQETPEGPAPTHYLLLADGRTVDSYGAVPTHIADGDQLVPVVRAYER